MLQQLILHYIEIIFPHHLPSLFLQNQSSSHVALISPPSYDTSSSSATSDDFRVGAAPLRHRIFSLGYVIEEPDVPGRLDVALLKARGIRPGPAYGQIKNGQDVVCPDGTVLHAADALGPKRKGEGNT